MIGSNSLLHQQRGENVQHTAWMNWTNSNCRMPCLVLSSAQRLMVAGAEDT